MKSQYKVSAGQRQQMISEAAYFRAERRGFNGGDAVRDWYEAEAEVDARLQELEDEQLVARIEEVLGTVSKKLAGVRRKAARLSTEARGEWQKDISKLVVLRDTLRPKLAELREHGEQASHRVREQADKIRSEITDLVQRLGTRVDH
jgi:ribosomal protein L29